jgi:glycosyltransferase involved in cell wall biosynthesis
VNGLELAHGEEIIVCGDGESMAAEITCLSRDAERRNKIGQRARARAMEYDWAGIVRRQNELYEQLYP